VRYLIDTQALIWAQDEPTKLGPAVIPLLGTSNATVYVSVATLWEIGIKIVIRKLTLSLPYHSWVSLAIQNFRLLELPVDIRYIERQIALPFHHRDPFDRMLAAQALVEGISVVSSDTIFDSDGVVRVWN